MPSSRSAITRSTCTRSTARVDVGVPADVFCRPDLNDFLALGPRGVARRARVRRRLRPRATAIDTDVVVDATRAARCCCPSRSATTSTCTRASTTRRTSAACSGRKASRCSPTGATSPSATTAGPARSPCRAPRSCGRCGHVADGRRGVEWQPSAQLDIELELAVVVGAPSRRGERVPIDDVDAHVFGMLLAQRLVGPRHPGLRVPAARPVPRQVVPHLGVAVARSLRRARARARRGAAGHPGSAARRAPADARARGSPRCTSKSRSRPAAMRAARRTAASPCRTSRWPTRSTGRPRSRSRTRRRTARRCAPATCSRSGTLSGPDPRTEGGSFIELTARGAQPLDLPNGETRGFLEDGDRVVMRGWCGSGSTRVGFGELDGTVVVGDAPDWRLTMPYYRHVGDVPRKRHSYVPAADGYLFEELMGHEGFAQESSLLYHLRLAERDRRGRSRGRCTGADHARPSTAAAPPPHRRDATGGRRRSATAPCLFANDDVRIAWFAATDRQRPVPRRDRRPTRLRAVGHRHAGVELRRARRSGPATTS